MTNFNLVFLLLALFFNQFNQAFRVFDVNGVHTILALDNETVNIVCSSGMPMAYCGFIHPDGRRFSLSASKLADGNCALKQKASVTDEGLWKCHIGKRSVGVEIKQSIRLRVVDKLTAIDQNVSAIHGKDVTLSCVTTQEKTSLRYCRFEPPNGSPFSIDPGVTASKPILGKYYFPTNRSLDRGDCAVTIHKVKYSDVGEWTCGAGFDDGKEYTDVIRLTVEGFYSMSTASTTGITFGTLGVIIILVVLGVLVWKKRRFMGTSARYPESVEIQNLPSVVVTGSPRDRETVQHVPVAATAPKQSPDTMKIQHIPLAGPSGSQKKLDTVKPSPGLQRKLETAQGSPRSQRKQESLNLQALPSTKTTGSPRETIGWTLGSQVQPANISGTPGSQRKLEAKVGGTPRSPRIQETLDVMGLEPARTPGSQKKQEAKDRTPGSQRKSENLARTPRSQGKHDSQGSDQALPPDSQSKLETKGSPGSQKNIEARTPRSEKKPEQPETTETQNVAPTDTTESEQQPQQAPSDEVPAAVEEAPAGQETTS